MSEDFLHFVWKYRLYDKDVATMGGETIEVLAPGQHNSDSGPDFSNARIRIGNTLWAGNVEVHVKASDWFAHGHQRDDAYANIILHVVYFSDRPIADRNGRPLVTLELRGKFDERMYQKYFYYLNNKNWIPCEKDIKQVSGPKMNMWLDRLLVERMERKAEELGALLRRNNNSFEHTFYQALAGNFGFKVNEQPFRMLATMLPLNVLAKHKNSLFQLEALLFGVAGMLKEDFSDDYPKQLKSEFGFLRKKYGLAVMEKHLWKFMRMRPSSFPTIRISQFAALIAKSESLFSKVAGAADPAELTELFDVAASDYWNGHFNFDKKSTVNNTRQLGDSAINNIMLNTVAQFLFLYSASVGDDQYREKALALLMQIAPETNAIIRGWAKTGIAAANAFETQALIELKNNYCNKKRCLDCAVGLNLLRMNVE